jgi:anti-sigma regulatory factor (Ser/Thr protein kinase)
MSIDRHREHSMSCQLSHEPAQVRQAREQARRALSRWGLGEHAELAGLIVSELATNAIKHGDGPVQVRVSYARGDLRVEVHDDGAERPVKRPVTADDETGRGLALLDDLIGLHGGTRAVANDSAGHGKTVHVTVRLAAGGSPATDASASTARSIDPGTPPGMGGSPWVAASCPDRRQVMCRHAPPCPPASVPPLNLTMKPELRRPIYAGFRTPPQAAHTTVTTYEKTASYAYPEIAETPQKGAGLCMTTARSIRRPATCCIS